MAGNVHEITDATFDSEVFKADGLVMVDFWAPWCGPCKALGPVLEELATEYAGKIKICKVNVDENDKMAHTYNVKSIPNLVFFKGGKVLEQAVGAPPKEQLVANINKLL